MPIKTENKKCSLCEEANVSSVNSHIIPNFIGSKAFSSDGRYKRNHEIVFSFNNATFSPYVGSEVPENVLRDTFDDLSDKRIENELKKNPLSSKYIFCQDCESDLSKYLETPYSNGKANANQSYFFWMSVLWRVNRFLTPVMPEWRIIELRKCLFDYLTLMKQRGDESTLNHPFSYRILICNEYCGGAGAFSVKFDNNIFTMKLGYIIVRFYFEESFLELEEEFKNAPLNNGTLPEKREEVSKEIFEKMYDLLLSEMVKSFRDTIIKIWNELAKKYPMPQDGPSNDFVKRVERFCCESSEKPAEKYTSENISKSFRLALKAIYEINVCENDE